MLTTLTRWMPSGGAVVVSALVFGAAHGSAKDLPGLAALGVLLGASYVRSRNLVGLGCSVWWFSFRVLGLKSMRYWAFCSA